MVQHASGADGEDTPSIKSPRSHSLHSAADSGVLRSAYTGVTNCAERFSPRISKKRKGCLSSSAVSSALSPGSECLFWAAPSTWRRVRPACPLAGSFSALAGGLCVVAWRGMVWRGGECVLAADGLHAALGSLHQHRVFARRFPKCTAHHLVFSRIFSKCDTFRP